MTAMAFKVQTFISIRNGDCFDLVLPGLFLRKQSITWYSGHTECYNMVRSHLMETSFVWDYVGQFYMAVIWLHCKVSVTATTHGTGNSNLPELCPVTFLFFWQNTFKGGSLRPTTFNSICALCLGF